MNHKHTIMIAIAGLGLAGPASMGQARAGDEQTHTQRPPGGGLTKSRERHVVATIQSIDKDARELTLIDEEGQSRTVTVPESVKRFDKLVPGQQVKIGYFESLAVALSKPGEQHTGTTTKQSSSEIPAGAGQGPGRSGLRQVTFTAEIMAVNAAENKVTLRGPEGRTRTIDVEDPGVRAKLATLKPGDTVDVTYTEAIAVTLVPLTKKK